MRGPLEAHGAGLVNALAAVGAVADQRAATPDDPASMPPVVGLREADARDVLLAAGVPAELIVSDYQDRAKLGDLFDHTVAYQVVSALPPGGAPLAPGQVVVLGVRAP